MRWLLFIGAAVFTSFVLARVAVHPDPWWLAVASLPFLTLAASLGARPRPEVTVTQTGVR